MARIDRPPERATGRQEHVPNSLEAVQHIETAQRNLELLEQQAQNTELSLENTDALDLDFDASNLDTPSGIQQELLKYDMRHGELGVKGQEISDAVLDFQQRFEDFNRQQAGLRGLLRGIGHLFSKDPRVSRMQERLERIQIRLSSKIRELRARRQEITAYEEKLQTAIREMRAAQEQERDQRLAEMGAQGQQINLRTSQQRNQYTFFTDSKTRTEEFSRQLIDYRADIQGELHVAEERRNALRVDEHSLGDFRGILQNSLYEIEEALHRHPPAPQRGELERARDELLAHGQNVDATLLEVTGGRQRIESASLTLEQNRQHTDERTLTLQGHLDHVVNPTLQSLERSIAALELSKLKNGNQREMVEGHYAQTFLYLNELEQEVSSTILQNRVSGASMLERLSRQKQELRNLSVSGVTASAVLDDLSLGTQMLFRDISGRLLDPASRWVKQSTQNVPVVNAIAEVGTNILIDLPSGVIEGTGELLSGITTLLAHPIQTLEGVTTLIPVYNATNGQWFDFRSAGQAWTHLGRAIVAYESFERGDVGKGVGKFALNILTTVTGVGAATKSAQGANIAYRVSRAVGSGALRSTVRASGTASRMFVTEFSSGLVNVPRNVLRSGAQILQSPSRWIRQRRLLRDQNFNEEEMARMVTEIEQLHGRVESLSIGGRNVMEIPGLRTRSARELMELSGEDLLALGISDTASITDFLNYRSMLRSLDDLEYTFSSAHAGTTTGMTDEMRATAPGAEVSPDAGGVIDLQRLLELKPGDVIPLEGGRTLQVIAIEGENILFTNAGGWKDVMYGVTLTKQQLLEKFRAGEFRNIQRAPAQTPHPSPVFGSYRVGETVRIRRSSGAIQEAIISEIDPRTGSIHVEWHETMSANRTMLDELNPQYMNDFRTGDVIRVNIEGEVHTAKIVQFDQETGRPLISYRKIKTCPRSEVDRLMREAESIERHGAVRPIRREMAPERPRPEPGTEVYIERSNGVLERGWIVDSVNPDGTLNVSKQAGRQRLIHRNHSPEEVFALGEIENQGNPNFSLPNAAANFERMKFNILRQQAVLSSEDFSQLFRSWPLQQRNVGNCYLISALNSLRTSPHFEMLMRTSIKVVQERRGFRTLRHWEVRIPLGDRNGQVIIINPEDLERTRNIQYGRPRPHRRDKIDERRYLEPIDASEGFKILEAAYIKYTTGGIMNRAAIEGGFGHQALLELLGDNFRKVKIDGNQGRYNIELGWRGDATAVQYGDAPNFNMARNSPVREDLFEFLDEFHPGKHMATANTPSASGGDSRRFRIPGVDYEFANNHAYSIVQTIRPSLSPDGVGRVTIANPWNTGEAIVLTYDQFSQVFSQISGVEMDYAALTRQLQEHVRVGAQ